MSGAKKPTVPTVDNKSKNTFTLSMDGKVSTRRVEIQPTPAMRVKAGHVLKSRTMTFPSQQVTTLQIKYPSGYSSQKRNLIEQLLGQAGEMARRDNPTFSVLGVDVRVMDIKHFETAEQVIDNYIEKPSRFESISLGLRIVDGGLSLRIIHFDLIPSDTAAIPTIIAEVINSVRVLPDGTMSVVLSW